MTKLKRLLAYPYYYANRLITQDEYKTNLGKWFIENGNEKYLNNHDLSENSVVFDVGGYVGVFSDRIIDKYNPYIYIFEPVQKYCDVLREKYFGNRKVKIFDFGLADKTVQAEIMIDDDKSSLFINSGVAESISLVDIKEFIISEKIDSVDLISINIEGGEYPLVNRMITADLIDQFSVVQLQFHNTYPDHQNLRKNIINALLQTHDKLFSFPYVWEGFRRKN